MLSRDVPAPGMGPAFLSLHSWLYRLEYAVATVALLVVVFGWRFALLHQFTSSDLALTIFWAVWPDLLAFIPIGIAASRTRVWPAWGSPLYNVGHSLLVAGAVLVVWSLLTGRIEWPLLGWIAHITADRAAGYYLRGSPTAPTRAD